MRARTLRAGLGGAAVANQVVDATPARMKQQWVAGTEVIGSMAQDQQRVRVLRFRVRAPSRT